MKKHFFCCAASESNDKTVDHQRPCQGRALGRTQILSHGIGGGLAALIIDKVMIAIAVSLAIDFTHS